MAKKLSVTAYPGEVFGMPGLEILGTEDLGDKMQIRTRSCEPDREGEENFVGDSEIIALGGASNETKDRPLG